MATVHPLLRPVPLAALLALVAATSAFSPRPAEAG
jgi:hypothetical protein